MFLRYVMVGIINTIIGLGTTLTAFHILKINYSLAYLIGTLMGVVCSFVLNKYFTFKSTRNWRFEAFKFFIVFIIAYLVSNACLIAVVELLKMPHDIGFLCSMVCYTLISYILSRKVVFKA